MKARVNELDAELEQHRELRLEQVVDALVVSSRLVQVSLQLGQSLLIAGVAVLSVLQLLGVVPFSVIVEEFVVPLDK